MILQFWPEQTASEELDYLWETAEIVFASTIRDANIILVNDVISLMPYVYFLGIFAASEIIFWTIAAVLFVMTIIKMIPFV
jgi:hypothetical protein